MKVNGLIRDLSALKRIGVKRKERILDASPKPLRHDPVKALARILHPERSLLRIDSIIDRSEEVKIIKFTLSTEDNSRFPVFQSGQYLSLTIDMDNTSVNRTFFISSPPFKASPIIDQEANCEPYIEIIVVKKENSISNDFIWKNWKLGKEIKATFPHGRFFYEPLRDSKNLICIAEDAGISPFYSLVYEIIQKDWDLNLIIFYKNKSIQNMVLIEDLKKLVEAVPTKLKIIVLNDNQVFNQEIVKLEKDIINKSTYFVCCSQEMYKNIYEELIKLKIPNRRIRKQVYGETQDIYDEIDFPTAAKEKKFKITILVNQEEKIIESLAKETVLVTLERAGIEKSSHCRSGECGFCRSRIIEGDIFVNTLVDSRRGKDKEHGYFHPCVSYPISDMTIDILK
ncbi:MAG: 2Fe-2S iron-sulfur cluster binding domain-containing protein [Clostridiaceae bacterium]|nr:2Fe-2S iron-sulfur cluster binding domain-containing protein [Clostridiaceae bacterium]